MSTRPMFIYGSLMRAQPQHRLLGEARFVAEVCTVPGFALVDLGAYPALTREGDGQVFGELFEVPESRLPQLDIYEDCPALYTREAIFLEGHGAAEAYLIDVMRLRGYRRIPSGRWDKKPGGSVG